MGKRPHARRVNRQPTQKNTRRVAKRTARKRPIAHDPLVAAHWDERLTVRQNYAQLGLAHRVNGVAGGTERSRAFEATVINSKEVEAAMVRSGTQADPLLDGAIVDSLAEAAAQQSARPLDLSQELANLDDEETLKRRLGPGRALIRRDDKGNIISVIMGTAANLDDDDDDDNDGLNGSNSVKSRGIPQVKAKSKLVQEMERRVAEHVPYQRFLAPGEIAWAKQVIAKHGTAYENAFRDMKLNTLQRTVGQIRNLCERYLAQTQSVASQ